jgi:hypothetical protein
MSRAAGLVGGLGGLGVGGGLGEGHARDGTEGFVGHTRFAAAWVRACV